MEERYWYYVRDWNDGDPTLIRLGSFASMKAELFAYPRGWVNMPHLNDIRVGKGCYMDYDEVSEEYAMKLMKEIQVRYDRMAAEKKKK